MSFLIRVTKEAFWWLMGRLKLWSGRDQKKTILKVSLSVWFWWMFKLREATKVSCLNFEDLLMGLDKIMRGWRRANRVFEMDIDYFSRFGVGFLSLDRKIIPFKAGNLLKIFISQCKLMLLHMDSNFYPIFGFFELPKLRRISKI